MSIQWVLFVLTVCTYARGKEHVPQTKDHQDGVLSQKEDGSMLEPLMNILQKPILQNHQNLNSEFELQQDKNIKESNKMPVVSKNSRNIPDPYKVENGYNANAGKKYETDIAKERGNINAAENVETNHASKLKEEFVHHNVEQNGDNQLVGNNERVYKNKDLPPLAQVSQINNNQQTNPSVIGNRIQGDFVRQNMIRKNDNYYQSDNKAPQLLKKPHDEVKVAWDRSDFSVNFDQYAMPEHKVRRAPHSSVGEPWPLPQYYVTKKNVVYKLDKVNFNFNIVQETCDVIEQGIERYRHTILEDAVQDQYDNLQNAQASSYREKDSKYEDQSYSRAPPLNSLAVKIRIPCTKYLTESSDESYDLFVKQKGAKIYANEVWGALRGLETFSQLVFKGSDGELYVRDTVINDYPRFPHRGILIDTARHYIFKDVLFDVLDGMAHNKMNVLHWHIVDDQSFPYQSRVYPDLSEKGAFHPDFVYTHEDISEIIEYARLRGIRVIPEFDTPGHTYSWGMSRPDLLTQCYEGGHAVNGYLGPMDPSKNETFSFLKNLFKEVLNLFKDKYVHLGGDEVPMTCWTSNPDISLLLARLEGRLFQPKTGRNDIYGHDTRKVLEYYENRLTGDLKDLGRKRSNGVSFIMWQEILNNYIQLPNDTVIQIWQGNMFDVQRAISLGYKVVYSTCWYLDLIEYGVKWPKYYNCDPVDRTMGFNFDESKVLGGEACLWAEYIDNENLMTALWPRASAVAERLWSSKYVKDLDKAGKRLQEHRCRMLSRGLAVGQISGPDYCLRRGVHYRHRNKNNNNCTDGVCTLQKDRVEIERIDVHMQRSERNIADCSNMSEVESTVLTVIVTLLIIGVILGLKKTGGRIIQMRLCRIKSILLIFLMIIFIYFMCYAEIWMQVSDVKGSFEKRTSSRKS